MLLGVRPFLHWPQGAPFPPCRRARQPDRSSRRKKPKFARWPTMFKSRWSKSKSEAWVTAWGGRLRPQEQDKISTWNRGREGSQNRASEKGQPPRQWVRVAAWEPDDGRWPTNGQRDIPRPTGPYRLRGQGWQVVARMERLCCCLGQGQVSFLSGRETMLRGVCVQFTGQCLVRGSAENKKPRLLIGSVQ